MEFPIGSELRFEASFKNASKVLADPIIVTIRLKPTTGTEVLFTYGIDVELVRTGVGLYYLLYTPTVVGLWKARWKGSGTVQAASPDLLFQIVPTALTA